MKKNKRGEERKEMKEVGKKKGTSLGHLKQFSIINSYKREKRIRQMGMRTYES